MKEKGSMNRRNFLRTSTIGAMGTGLLFHQHLLPENKLQSGSLEPTPKIKAYRTLGRTGFKASDIGIGTSRMFSTPVINALLDAGVNYIDTAESYGRGASETSIGKAIKGRDRKSLFITTKLHIREDIPKNEVISRFRKCLERLNTDYIDALFIHNASSTKILKTESFHEAAKQLKTEGKLRFTGVSNHGPRRGEAEDMETVLMNAVKDGRFDIMLLVFNFIQKDAGARVLAACREKNIATTIMKSNPVVTHSRMKGWLERVKKEGNELGPAEKARIQKLDEMSRQIDAFTKKHRLENPTEIRNAAVRFVLSDPNVNVLNLAFKNFDDVDIYLKLSGTQPDEKEKQKLANFAAKCSSFYCRHACGICESQCPEQVPINTIMRYNHYFDVNECEKYAMEKYAALTAPVASNCASCVGSCEKACPYGVPVQAMLAMAHQQLTLT